MELKVKAVLFPRVYSNGNQPILIRVTQNRKSNYISSGDSVPSVPSGAWNNEKAEVWESITKAGQTDHLRPVQIDHIGVAVFFKEISHVMKWLQIYLFNLKFQFLFV